MRSNDDEDMAATTPAHYFYVVADNPQEQPSASTSPQSVGLRVKASLTPVAALLDEAGEPREGACLVRLRVLAGSGEVLQASPFVGKDGQRSKLPQTTGLPPGYNVVGGSGASVDRLLAPDVDM